MIADMCPEGFGLEGFSGTVLEGSVWKGFSELFWMLEIGSRKSEIGNHGDDQWEY
jgi:hypothetical protein